MLQSRLHGFRNVLIKIWNQHQLKVWFVSCVFILILLKSPISKQIGTELTTLSEHFHTTHVEFSFFFSPTFLTPSAIPGFADSVISSKPDICRLHPAEKDQASTHFAVLIPIFARQADPYFFLERYTCIKSVLNQFHTHWTIIFVGDGLTESEQQKFKVACEISNIPPQKVIFFNMDPVLRESNMFPPEVEHPELEKCKLWCIAGFHALNIGLDFLNALNSKCSRLVFTHVARLDSDDIWFPDHLSNADLAYSTFDDISFTFSQTYHSVGAIYPKIFSANTITVQPPPPCWIAHSSVTWSLNHTFTKSLYYRSPLEQKMKPRNLSLTPGACTHDVFAVDADMWQRVWEAHEKHIVKSAFVCKTDVEWVNGHVKKGFLDMAAEEYSKKSGGVKKLT